MFTKMKKRLREQILIICLLLGCSALQLLANAAAPVYVPSAPRAEALTAAEDIDSDATLPTVTVRGFLNFRTTVDGTVIVFTPASGTPQDPTPASSAQTSSSSAASFSPRNDDIQHLSYTGNDKESQKRTELENEAHTPEDDRQNFRQRHLKPGYGDLGTTPGSLRNEEPQQNLQKPGATPSLPQYPTGLVTVLGGTHVKDGATTVFETKVIGTYIEGKYAQILQSTSQIIFPAKAEDLSTPKPSPTKPVFQKSASLAVTSSRPVPTKPIKNLDHSSRNYRPTVGSNAKEYKATTVGSRQAERRTDDPVNANTVLQSSFKLPENAQNRQSTSPTQSLDKTLERSSYTISRRFRPTLTTDIPPEDENTVPESQNGRRTPPRHRYVLPRRNTPSVRLNRFKVKLTVRNDEDKRTELVTPHDNTFDPEDELIDDYGALNNHPVDPAKVVYEKTTITSEVTLHVGRRKSVRTLTITTNVPKTRHAYPSDVLGINDAQDISPANNNAIFATLSDEDAAPHIVVTRTYTTTERMLKTSLVPVLENDTTSYHTVTESFFILKLITGYKTLPAADMTILSQNDTSEIEYDDSSDLLEGAVPLQPSPRQQIIQTAVPNGLLQASGSGREQAIVPYEKTTKSVSDDLSNSLMSLGAALQQNPLAAVYLGLQQLNRQATLYSTKTKTSTYIHTDTIYSTKVVSFYDGRRTRTRTLSESISTTEKTMTSLTTTVEPYLNTQFFQQQNQLQQLLGVSGTGAQLLPAPQQYSTVTSTYTTVTTATSLSTRIYTLIYNAISTKFRTVTSTSLYETTITATTTSEVPIAITAPPGGVFPFLG